MASHPVVTIGTYDAEPDARDDLARLRAVGIDGDVATVAPDEDGFTVALQVAEGDVDVAVALLSDAPVEPPATVETPPAGTCPRCGSPRSERLPSRAAIVIAVSVAATAWLVWQRLWPWVVGWWVASGLLVRWVERRPQWRCRNCQWQWNADVEAERRAALRRPAATARNAPE